MPRRLEACETTRSLVAVAVDVYHLVGTSRFTKGNPPCRVDIDCRVKSPITDAWLPEYYPAAVVSPSYDIDGPVLI